MEGLRTLVITQK